MARLRLLHAIHDFLPRHHAGSEIYAFELARELSGRHDVFVLAAEYDPVAAHGAFRWRVYDGLTVIEIVNNWAFDRFEETYSSPRINQQLSHVLDATQPDVLHVHNLLNLSFDLPRLARERSIPSVATLHDYTLVCPSGGQRVHIAESHVCDVIDPERCSRCFGESTFHSVMVGGAVARKAGRLVARAGLAARRVFPVLTDSIAQRVPSIPVSADDISRRLSRARQLFDTVALFVSPSAALAAEYVRLGCDASRIRVSDYGFAPSEPLERSRKPRTLQIGFAGTLAWHKGVHVLIEAAQRLTGKFHLRICGDTNTFPTYSARLERDAAGLPVEFTGAFDREDLSRIYGGFDVLVVPSLWPENSPLVIHEAFMHGVAVVGANHGGIPELVTHGVNGLIYEAHSPGALAAALQRFVDDPNLASTYAGSAPAVKTIAQDASEWEARYEEVLSVGRRH
jgi:glycosyltransferase involved in cell wall biosynthesis